MSEIDCIANSGLYFGSHHSSCSGTFVVIPDFFACTPSGDLNCYICQKHAQEARMTHNYKSYLYRRLMGATEELAHLAVPE
jgi:hypothetical protein